MSSEMTAASSKYLVTVEGKENNEWQGTIQFSDGTCMRFESLLMLLRLINKNYGFKLPAWTKRENVK